MSRRALNKAELQKQQRALKTYRQFLPSLDLKRRQLLAERAAARIAAAEAEAALGRAVADIGAALPMLADERVDLTGLVTVREVRIAEQNRLGVRLPELAAVTVDVAPYSALSRPHWVDPLAARLAAAARLELEAGVARARLSRLERAVRVITQRVNLFEKVLIPRAEAHVRQIKLHLSDAERAAVVRAKLAKQRLTGDRQEAAW